VRTPLAAAPERRRAQAGADRRRHRHSHGEAGSVIGRTGPARWPSPAGAAVGAGLVALVERFVRDLRRAGVATGVTSVVEGCSALACVDIGQREQVRLALRCTLVKRAEDEAVFEALFATRFAVRRPAPAATARSPGGEGDLLDRIVGALAAGDDRQLVELADEAAERHGGFGTADGSDRYHLQRTLRALRPDTLAHGALVRRRDGVPRRDEATERDDRAEVQARLDRFLAALAGATKRRRDRPDGGASGGGASDGDLPYVRVEDVDIADASVVELRRLRAAVRPLARRLAARIARRRQRPEGTLDVRRTIRRSLAAGGVPLDPTFRRRTPHRADLWLLCDVSGSVAEFARFTIGLLTALHDEVPRLRSFLFVDDLVEVTGLLAARTHEVDPFALVAGAGAPLGGRQSDWGAALARFRDDHGPDLTRRSTVVVTGDARTHDRAPRADVMAELVRRTRGVWLLDPEPVARWAADDAVVAAYRGAGAHALEVRTLGQLATAVEDIVRAGVAHERWRT
jgi:uncharacterized protein with von Willebrand factor type A (vWA) domain